MNKRSRGGICTQLAVTAIVGIVLTSCTKSADQKPVASPTAGDARDAVADSSNPKVATAQTNHSSAQATRSEALALPPRPAPKGIYFLRTRQSMTTANGVRGYNPGTEVKVVSETALQATVSTQEGVRFHLMKSQLTNDLNERDRLRGNTNKPQGLAKAE